MSDETTEAIKSAFGNISAYIDTLGPIEQLRVAFALAASTVETVEDPAHPDKDARATAAMNLRTVGTLIFRALGDFPVPDKIEETILGFGEMFANACYEINWAAARNGQS